MVEVVEVEKDDEVDDEEEMCAEDVPCLFDFLSTTAGCLFLRGQVEVAEAGVSFHPGWDTGGLGETDRRLRASCSICDLNQSVEETAESLRVPP